MLDLVIVGVYFVIVLALGSLQYKQNRTLREFSLSHGHYGSFVIFATLSASYIGGGFSTGNASKVFLFGVANIVALWGFSCKEILVARYIVPRLSRFSGAISVGDIMGECYGKGGKILAGVFGFLLCAGIMAAQVGAMGYMFNVFLGIDLLWGILIGCGLAIVYSTLGGMRAVILTDVMQFCLLAVGIPVALIMGVLHVGGIGALVDKVPAEYLNPINSEISWVALVSMFFVMMFGETLVPPYIQRMLIGKDLKTTARATFWSGVFSFPFFIITGLFGLVACALEPELDSNLSMPHVIMTVVPTGMLGLIIAGMISIVISSADSFLNSAAVCGVQDIIVPLCRKPLSDEKAVGLARLINALTGTIAIVIAISIPNVIDILIFAYTFWTPVILVPLTAGILGFRTSKLALLTSSLAGLGGFYAWNYTCGAPWNIDAVFIGLLASLAVFTLTTVAQPKPSACV